MKTKNCRKCKQDRPVSDFRNRKESFDGLSSWCRPCSLDNSRRHYYASGKKDLMAKNSKDRRILIGKLVDEIKVKYGCFNCGERDSICLDFHHLDPADKDGGVSDWVRKKSFKKVFREINKSVVVCANCHRKVHYNKITPSQKDLCVEKIEDYATLV